MNNLKKDPAKFHQVVMDKLNNGQWPFSVPTGYMKGEYKVITRVYNDNLLGSRVKPVMVRDLIVNNSLKDFVIGVFEDYATGKYTLDSLCRLIKYRKTGNPVSSTGLHHTLTNRFYIGEMIFEGKVYYHNYPCFITIDLFNKCRDILSSYNRSGKPVYSTPVSDKKNVAPLYSKMIECVVCGGVNLCGEWQKGFVYYKCASKKRRFNEEINEKHFAKYLKEIKISECFLIAFDDIDRINMNKFLMGSLDSLASDLSFFKQYYRTWFMHNHLIKRDIVNLLFKDLAYDGRNLMFHIRSPFNGEAFQDFKHDDLRQIISKMGYPPSIEETVPKKSTTESLIVEPLILEENPVYKKILNFCNKPVSGDILFENVGISLSDLQNALFDLQISGRIEQDELGYWRLR